MSSSIQYITDSDGKPVAVIVPINEFERMLAEMGLTLQDYQVEPSDPSRIVLDKLRAAGKIEI